MAKKKKNIFAQIVANYVICDLDGTLSDDSHRREYARRGEWDEYHKRLGGDIVTMPVLRLLMAMKASGFRTIILTGRPERYRVATMEWMERELVAAVIDGLLMRSDDDYSPAHELKPKMLTEMLGDKSNQRVLFILEDTEKVVRAWRLLGYKVFQVGDGA